MVYKKHIRLVQSHRHPFYNPVALRYIKPELILLYPKPTTCHGTKPRRKPYQEGTHFIYFNIRSMLGTHSRSLHFASEIFILWMQLEFLNCFGSCSCTFMIFQQTASIEVYSNPPVFYLKIAPI